MVQPLWESVWRFLRKLDMTLPEDPAIPLLSIYPKDSPACNKDTCSIIFIAAIFIFQPEAGKNPDILQWRNGNRKCGIYIYTMEHFSAIKNNEFMKFLGKLLALENIILNEVTQSQKNTHGM